MAADAQSAPSLPPAPKRTERASFRRDMSKIAGAAMKLAPSKRTGYQDIEKVHVVVTEKKGTLKGTMNTLGAAYL